MRPKLAEPRVQRAIRVDRAVRERAKRFIGRRYGLGPWVTQPMAGALEREPQHMEVVRG